MKGVTILSYLKPVMSFFAWHKREDLNWKRITAIVPKFRRFANDRTPTLEEIRKLLSVLTIRDKALVLILLASGIRIGAIESLKLSDLERIKVGEREVGFLQIYSNTEADGYSTFCTPEALKALDAYLDYRKRAGELLKESSPLFRESFDYTGAVALGRVRHKSTNENVKPIKTKTAQNILRMSWLRCGVNEVKHNSHEMKSFKCAHGFRKFFVTSLETAGMKTMFVKRLAGHEDGSHEAYLRPNDAMLEEYVKYMQALCIGEEWRDKDERTQRLKQALASIDLLVDDPDQRETIRKMIETSDSKIEYDDLMIKVRQMLRNSSNDPLLKWAREPKSLEQSTDKVAMKKRVISSENDVQKYLDSGYIPRYEMRNGSVVMELVN